MTQMAKNPPAIQETWVWSLAWKDLLEKEMAIQSSILTWRIPWTQEPCALQSIGFQRVRHNWVTFTFTFICWALHSPWCVFYSTSDCNLLKTHLWFCQSSVLGDKVFPQLLKIKVLDKQCLAGLTPLTSCPSLCPLSPQALHTKV